MGATFLPDDTFEGPFIPSSDNELDPNAEAEVGSDTGEDGSDDSRLSDMDLGPTSPNGGGRGRYPIFHHRNTDSDSRSTSSSSSSSDSSSDSDSSDDSEAVVE